MCNVYLGRALGAGALTLTLALAACAAPSGPDDPAASGSSAIIGASPANDYPEAALVNMMDGDDMVAACSGAVIAPRVVLTAGHCVHNFEKFRVTAPYASGQTASSKRGLTFDWNNERSTVDPSEHDIGLIFLESEIVLPAYPEIAHSAVADGTLVLNIGRIEDGKFSTADLFTGPPTTVRSAAGAGFPYDYIADQVIQSGDSGGPVYAAGTRTIISVNSGAGRGKQVLARVDLLASWIEGHVSGQNGH